MNIEVVEFLNLEFGEIPNQDNPAMTHLFEDVYKKNRCLMIVKANKRHQIGTPHGFSVLLIDDSENKGDRVLSLGVFYKLDCARFFADSYAEKIMEPK